MTRATGRTDSELSHSAIITQATGRTDSELSHSAIITDWYLLAVNSDKFLIIWEKLNSFTNPSTNGRNSGICSEKDFNIHQHLGGLCVLLMLESVMIAQWDSSLSVLSVARVMIAQWDSPLSVLPVAWVMIAQWDSSLSVLSMAQVMIAQWDGSLSVLPMARVQFPVMVEYFKGLFPGWSHSANLSWASVAENGSISLQWHHTTRGQRGGRPKSNHGQTMADRKKMLEARIAQLVKSPNLQSYRSQVQASLPAGFFWWWLLASC